MGRAGGFGAWIEDHYTGTANVNLDLTQEDVAILRDVIRSYLSELHDEIVHTENYEFREGLQARQRRLQDLLERLGGESS
jgi:LPS O-antigen subunit length determinant protein (WzzB/FepE family)